jgi:hypothetical protein
VIAWRSPPQLGAALPVDKALHDGDEGGCSRWQRTSAASAEVHNQESGAG